VLETPFPVGVVIRLAGALGDVLVERPTALRAPDVLWRWGIGLRTFVLAHTLRFFAGIVGLLLGFFAKSIEPLRFQVLQAEEDVRREIDEFDADVVLIGPDQRLILGAIARHRIDEGADRNGIGIGEDRDRRPGPLSRDVFDQVLGVREPFDEHDLGTNLVQKVAQMPRSRRRQVSDTEDVDASGTHEIILPPLAASRSLVEVPASPAPSEREAASGDITCCAPSRR
jgi:hypothetical protein